MKIVKGQIDEIEVYRVTLERSLGTGSFSISVQLGYKAEGRPVGEVQLSGLFSAENDEISKTTQDLVSALERVCGQKLQLVEETDKKPETPRGLLSTMRDTPVGGHGSI